MIHEVKFISHSLLWTGAVKRKVIGLERFYKLPVFMSTAYTQLTKTVSITQLLNATHTHHRIPALDSQLFILLHESVGTIIREPQTVLNKSYHTALLIMRCMI